jgi:GntR family transcriptional repressor for pyruvate dehydrogenase complex
LDALYETRLILEVNTARLAAEKALKADLIDLIRIHEAFRKKIKNQDNGWPEDHQFHLKIAECSKNPVLCSLITLMAQNLAAVTRKTQDPEEKKRGDITLAEHEKILQAIKRNDPDEAALAMEVHMESALRR